MRLRLGLAVCAVAALVVPARASTVTATLAAELPLAIYTGAADGTNLELVAVSQAALVDGVLKPEEFSFDIRDDQYLYIVLWGAALDARGLLGEFVLDGLVVLSGDPAWEVVAATLDTSAGAPRPSEVAVQVRRANRRYAWVKCSALNLNGSDGSLAIAGIGREAAWMWLPGGAADTGAGQTGADTSVNAAIFRIAPSRLWPEFDLLSERNAGRGSLGGGGGGSGNPSLGGGTGGGGGSGAGPNSGQGSAPPFPLSPTDFAPPNSSTVPARVTPQRPTTPLLPPSTESNPATTPPTEHQSDLPKPPPEDNPPTPPPSVPEPSTALLALLVVGRSRPRR